MIPAEIRKLFFNKSRSIRLIESLNILFRPIKKDKLELSKIFVNSMSVIIH